DAVVATGVAGRSGARADAARTGTTRRGSFPESKSNASAAERSRGLAWRHMEPAKAAIAVRNSARCVHSAQPIAIRSPSTTRAGRAVEVAVEITDAATLPPFFLCGGRLPPVLGASPGGGGVLPPPSALAGSWIV